MSTEMKYVVEMFDTVLDEWIVVHESENAIRIRSNQFVPKIVFETDDPEYNG